MEILNLVLVFFRIGVVSFGGGWSIVGIIKSEVVPRWLDEAGFRSLVAIAQSTPGPIALNAATLIGWNQGGILGALSATFSVVAFPMIAIAVAGWLGPKIPLKKKALDEALRTSSMSMMLMTLWTLRPDSADPVLLGLTVMAFALSAFTKLNSLWAILGAGFINAAFGPFLRGLFGIPS